jgi:hypothetical protein
MADDLLRMQKETNFSQTVLNGINAIQKFQRQYAPIGKTGKGPHGNIPRSIKPARVHTRPDGSAWAESKTDYGPAIFTSEGTGQFGPRKRPYFIARHSSSYNSRGYWHPGQRGTNWWDRGANFGSVIALSGFQRKVERILGMRTR